ncbi:MAG: LysM peptidoglycan-binding domain-containing protein [Anaerolineales bacterium]|nr:LysM peptidoglycan-binding domain-containing protein [Anaerolineales bacterium]
MNEHPLKKILRHLAEEEFPPGTDLWPEIQQAMERAHPKRNEMAIRFSNFTRAVAFGAMLVLLTLGLVWVLSNTSAQPAKVTTEITPPSELPQLVATSTPVPTVTFVPTINSQVSAPYLHPTPISYIVGGDDTCIIIATFFKVSVQSIIDLNKLSSSCTLKAGQALLIPVPTPTPGANYETLRNSGIEKILAGDLEGGLLELDKAEKIQGLDGDAAYYADLASQYLIGVSFWDVDWEQAVYYFGQVAHYEPGLHDSTGFTAGDRYVTALDTYISQLVAEQDWCKALTYHNKLEQFTPEKITESEFQTSKTELVNQCAIQKPPLITMDSASDTIRQTLIDSKLNWTTLFADVMITRMDGDMTTHKHARIWFVAPDKGREMYDFENDNLVDKFVFMNNTIRTTFNLNLGSKPLWTKTTEVLDFLPSPSVSILDPGTTFAVNGMHTTGGTFRPTSPDTIAGRETLIVEWSDDAGILKDRLWIDIYTGVVLKWENLREGYMDTYEGTEYLRDAKIEVLEIVYDERYREDILFNPELPDEPIYMDASNMPTELPIGNLDLAALQAQVEFPILFPSVLPENYTFSGWYYTPNEVPVTLEFDCGRGTSDWWAFSISLLPTLEKDIPTQLLRTYIDLGPVWTEVGIEKVMIGDTEGEYLQGDWIETFDPVTLKSTGKEWVSTLNIHHLAWYQDGVIYFIMMSRAAYESDYHGACRLDKEQLISLATSMK